MIKTFLFLTSIVLLLLSVAACSKKKLPDGPLPASLQEIIAADTNCTCEPFLAQLLWKDRVIYLWSCAGPACNCTSLYYDDAGKPFSLPAGYDLTSFGAETKRIKTVWSCGN